MELKVGLVLGGGAARHFLSDNSHYLSSGF